MLNVREKKNKIWENKWQVKRKSWKIKRLGVKVNARERNNYEKKFEREAMSRILMWRNVAKEVKY